jgi:8-oxo-dGTP diphosphatase
MDAAIKRLGKACLRTRGFELLDKKFPSQILRSYIKCTAMTNWIDETLKEDHGIWLPGSNLKESVQRGVGRPARLYQFNRKKYFELKEHGYNFDLFL